MRGSRLRLRRPLFALGAIAACTITATAAAPAYARPAHRAGLDSGSAAAYATAPTSGHLVAGAVFGAVADRAAGPAVTGFLREHRRLAAEVGDRKVPSASQLHAWWGIFPDVHSGSGMMATQSVSPALRLSNSNDILYAPTMAPADNSCIEVVTVHTTHTPQIWAWDWCGKIRPVAVAKVTASFLKDYTAVIDGRAAYTTKDIRTNAKTNTWTAYLFNYATRSWDTLWTQSGAGHGGLTFGWDMFEFYSSTNPVTGDTFVCGDLRRAGAQIESSGISIRSHHIWTPANSANTTWNPEAHPNPESYRCPDMRFHIVQHNSDWMVDVPGN